MSDVEFLRQRIRAVLDLRSSVNERPLVNNMQARMMLQRALEESSSRSEARSPQTEPRTRTS